MRRVTLAIWFLLVALSSLNPLFAQPDNDLFRYREPIQGIVAEVSLYDLDASLEVDEPRHAESQATQGSVWWLWEAPEDGFLMLRVAAIGSARVLNVYEGQELRQLTRVASDRMRGSLTLQVRKGVAYSICSCRLANEPVDAASLQLRFSPPAVNDSFATGMELSGEETGFEANLVLATPEPFEPEHASGLTNGASLWYTWRTEADGVAVLSSTGQLTDSWMSVFEGDSLHNLRRVGFARCGKDLIFPVAAQKTYRIAVVKNASDAGELVSLRLASSQIRITSPVEGADLTSADPLLVEWTGSSPVAGAGQILDQGVEVASIPASTSSVLLPALSPGAHSLVVRRMTQSGFWVASLPVGILVRPRGDDFNAPNLLAVETGGLAGDDSAASVQSGELAPVPNLTGTIWWRYVAPSDGLLMVGEPSVIGLKMDFFRGSTLSGLTPVARGPQIAHPDVVPYPVVRGETYFLRSTRFHGSPGEFSCAIGFAPVLPHDAWEQRKVLSGFTASDEVVAGAATFQAGEPDGNRNWDQGSLWYEWSSPGTGSLEVAVSQGGQPARVIVYQGDALATLVPLTDSGEHSHVLSSRTSERYLFQALANTGIQAPFRFELKFTAVPTNDAFAEAQVISGLEGEVELSTGLASVEANEPPPLGQRSLWYRWTASDSTFLELKWGSNSGSNLFIDVYRSASPPATLASLTRIEPVAYAPGVYSVVKGTTYFIRVRDSLPAGEVWHRLIYRLHLPPANDRFANRMPIEGTEISISAAAWSATRETGEPLHGGAPTGRSVWWTWKAPADGWVTVAVRTPSLAEFGWVPYVAVYSGAALGSLTLQSKYSREDGVGVAGFKAKSGTSYQIAIDSISVSAGGWSVHPGSDIELALQFTTLRLTSPLPDARISGFNPVVFDINQPDPSLEGHLTGVSYRWVNVYSPSLPATVSFSESASYRWSFNDFPVGQFVVVAVATNDLGEIKVSAPVVFTRATPNDDFTNRIHLNGSQGTILGSLETATRQTGEPPTPAYAGAVTVWYSWTALVDGEVVLNSAIAGAIAVFTGDKINELTKISSNANQVSGGQRWVAVRGQTYSFQVQNVRPVPPVDMSALPFELRWFQQPVIVRSPSASQTLREGDTVMLAAEVADRSEAVASVKLLVDDQLVGETNIPPARFERLWVADRPGLHRIQAEMWLKSGEILTSNPVLFSVLAGNTNLPSARSIHGSEAALVSDVTAGNRLWFRWTAPSNGVVLLHTLDFHTAIHVYEVGDGTSLVRVGDYQTQVLAGKEYAIELSDPDRLNPLGFNVSFRFLATPPNDQFADRFDLPGAAGAYVISSASLFSTVEAGESPDLVEGQPTLWWRFKPIQRGVFGFNAQHGFFSVFQGDSLSSLVRYSPPNAGFGYDYWLAEPGHEYQVAFADTFNLLSAFTFELEFIAAVTNDLFASRALLKGTHARASSYTLGASRDVGEPFHAGVSNGRSVWWSWTAPTNGTAELRFERAEGLAANFAVYRGGSVGALTRVAEGTPSLRFDALKGLRYEIVVDSFGAGDGYFEFSLNMPDSPDLPSAEDLPSNDGFEHAMVLSGMQAAVSGANLYASRERFEPRHGNRWGGRSVWYQWQAPRDGTADIELTGTFHLLAAVYRGESLYTMTSVADADGPSGPVHLRFPVRAGGLYLIAVDGWLGETGTFDLRLSLEPMAAPLGLSIVSSGSDQLSLVVAGQRGLAFEIETSDDLVRWSLHVTIPAQAGKDPVMIPLDPERTLGARFFRLRSLR